MECTCRSTCSRFVFFSFDDVVVYIFHLASDFRDVVWGAAFAFLVHGRWVDGVGPLKHIVVTHGNWTGRLVQLLFFFWFVTRIFIVFWYLLLSAPVRSRIYWLNGVINIINPSKMYLLFKKKTTSVYLLFKLAGKYIFFKWWLCSGKRELQSTLRCSENPFFTSMTVGRLNNETQKMRP